MSKQDKSALYDVFLHFNYLTGYWSAIPRDKVQDYMNGTLDKNEDKVIKNKDIMVLITYISKL